MAKRLIACILVIAFTISSFGQSASNTSVNSEAELLRMQKKYHKEYFTQLPDLVSKVDCDRWYKMSPIGDPKHSEYDVRYNPKARKEIYDPQGKTKPIDQITDAGLGGASGMLISRVANTFLDLKFRPKKFKYINDKAYTNETTPGDATVLVRVYEFELSLEESSQGIQLWEGFIPGINFFRKRSTNFAYNGKVYIEKGTDNIRYLELRSLPATKETWDNPKLFDYYNCQIWMDVVTIQGTGEKVLMTTLAKEQTKVHGRGEYGYNIWKFSNFRIFTGDVQEKFEQN